MDLPAYERLLRTYFADGTEAFLPQVSINCVVFRYTHPRLEVLFSRVPGMEEWYLPGGYVRKDETLEAAAYRNLTYSGIEQVFLRQIYT
ncbi:MAG: NUDIX hydrolase, partial [Bacteroidetes bacterium]